MKKMIFILTTVAAAVIITGCASIQTAGQKDLNGQKLTMGKQNIAHINGQNWGLYLLSIPILSGSTEKPGDISFMKDTVNLKSVTNLVTAKSKDLGADTTADMVSNVSSTWLVPTFVLFLRQVEVSGNAVK